MAGAVPPRAPTCRSAQMVCRCPVPITCLVGSEGEKRFISTSQLECRWTRRGRRSDFVRSHGRPPLRGERLAYERIENGKADLRLLTIATGQDESLCADQCGNPVSWSPDGQWVLAERGDSIRAIHVPSKRFSDILQRLPLRLWQASVNPRTKGTCILDSSVRRRGEYRAGTLRRGQASVSGAVGDVGVCGNEDKVRWSADGRTLYFVSDRDGFRCVWGQRITSEPLKAAGDAFAVFHSHRARRSMKDLRLPMFSMWVIGNGLFFVQAEKTGNIWMMEGREAAR